MRRGFGLIGLVVTVVLLAIVGVIAYNVGWSDGLATHVPAGTVEAPQYYYGYGPHQFGWGFGILWFLFIVFGLFWLFRIAFSDAALGRWMGLFKGVYGHGECLPRSRSACRSGTGGLTGERPPATPRHRRRLINDPSEDVVRT